MIHRFLKQNIKTQNEILVKQEKHLQKEENIYVNASFVNVYNINNLWKIINISRFHNVQQKM